MPNKRNRKDSTSSQVGSSESSTSEESADNCITKSCCYNNCLVGETDSSEAWVKVICSNEECSSTYMHVECFKQFEDTVLYYLKSQGRARSWSEKQRRQNLWTKKGFDLAYKACVCSCKKGHLKKDCDWVSSVVQGDLMDSKKKNRKKGRDIQVMSNGKSPSTLVPFQRSKSKPIPGSSHARIRTNSTSSAISLDQGYNSSSPSTAEINALFSPSAHHYWSTSRFNPVILQRANGNILAPSASPLPEQPDQIEDEDTQTFGSPQFFTPSPLSTQLSLPTGTGYSPPFSPDHQQRPFYPARNLHTVKEVVVGDPFNKFGVPLFNLKKTELDYTQDFNQQPPEDMGTSSVGLETLVSPSVTTGMAKELKMQQERENERKSEGKSSRNKANGERNAKNQTAIKMVPLRHTVFKQRFDFSVFQNVLTHQHVNPYHIKMEGEGYGSDDLRNFILSSLSLASCSQMNCVVCGFDMPVYDHFPLVDGTMFLSPERNENRTKRGIKITVEGKSEYVHAACIRCLEGMHNIVCKICKNRWQGSNHQLGTLYMYDIFAADPCCQARLSCKHCSKLNNFSIIL